VPCVADGVHFVYVFRKDGARVRLMRKIR